MDEIRGETKFSGWVGFGLCLGLGSYCPRPPNPKHVAESLVIASPEPVISPELLVRAPQKTRSGLNFGPSRAAGPELCISNRISTRESNLRSPSYRDGMLTIARELRGSIFLRLPYLINKK